MICVSASPVIWKPVHHRSHEGRDFLPVSRPTAPGGVSPREQQQQVCPPLTKCSAPGRHPATIQPLPGPHDRQRSSHSPDLTTGNDPATPRTSRPATIQPLPGSHVRPVRSPPGRQPGDDPVIPQEAQTRLDRKIRYPLYDGRGRVSGLSVHRITFNRRPRRSERTGPKAAALPALPRESAPRSPRRSRRPPPPSARGPHR